MLKKYHTAMNFLSTYGRNENSRMLIDMSDYRIEYFTSISRHDIYFFMRSS